MSEVTANEQLIARLRRIEGQVRGIARMLDGERSCEDVVTQLMAVRSSIANTLLQHPDHTEAGGEDHHLVGRRPGEPGAERGAHDEEDAAQADLLAAVARELLGRGWRSVVAGDAAPALGQIRRAQHLVDNVCQASLQIVEITWSSLFQSLSLG